MNVIVSDTYLSVGDMIRDLDSKALIRSDFVLLDGGVVSNLPLRPILEEHRYVCTSLNNVFADATGMLGWGCPSFLKICPS